MTNSNCTAWQNVRNVEDLLALVNQVDERRRVIRKQAWHEGSWRAVFEEATAMRAELNTLHDLLADAWGVLYAVARSTGDE